MSIKSPPNKTKIPPRAIDVPKIAFFDKISPKKIMQNYTKIKKKIGNKNKNLVIGFGITSNNISSFKFSDGCVVGSEICKKISKSIKNRQNPVINVSNMLKKLRRKLS